ncbi:hypothetical protein CR513_12235, partial [Mucuna pruriens]
MHLLEEELARAKLSKEYLVDQRRESLFELVKARVKVDEAKSQYQTTIQELNRTLESWKQRCQDIDDEAKIQVQAATVETPFWKDRYIKLGWLANQAPVDIPRSLRAAEGMVDPTIIPREILQERRVIAPCHRYRTRSQAKDMEDAVESLEQQNQELKGEIGQLQEQMTGNVASAPRAQGPDRANVENPGAEGLGASYQSPQDPNKVLQAMPGSIPPIQAIEGIGSHGLDAIDLYLVPDIILPADFKVPKFEKYKGSSCPRVHLAMYCRKMASFIHQDKILVHYFQDSLTGAALSWYVNLESGRVKTWRDLAEAFVRQYKYNEDMTSDRSRLQYLSKADSEGFKNYAQRWRELAAQVQPPLSEKEMVTMFIDTLPSPFYGKVMGSVAINFADLVSIGEMIESSIKRGKFAQTSTNTSFSKKARYEKKKGEANAILIDPASQSKVILSKLGAPTPADSVIPPKEESTPSTSSNRPSERNSVFASLPMTYTALFPTLLQKNMIAILPLKSLEPPYPRSYDPNAKCDYHAKAVGHSTERCWSFKHKVQHLIDVGWLKFKENEPNVNTNPLPAHGGQSINILSHEIWDFDGMETIQTNLAEVAVLRQEEGRPHEPLIIRYDPIYQPPTPLTI